MQVFEGETGTVQSFVICNISNIAYHTVYMLGTNQMNQLEQTIYMQKREP